MKITRLETLLVRPRWLFLKMHADAGLAGCGDAVVEGRALTVQTAVHEPAGCLQLDACTPNFVVQEYVHLGEGILKQPFELRDGAIPVPEGPGRGIELNEEALQERLGHDWKSPQTYHDDGSVADW